MTQPYYRDHDLFIGSIRKMLEVDLKPRVDNWEHGGNFPDEVFQILGQQGFLGILVPPEYDGIGGDYKMAGAWCETFGELPSVGLTIGVNMHSLVVSAALAKYGSIEAKDRWLKSAVNGEAIGAYAFTEPGAGSDLASLRTKAERKGSKWIINGSKTFITNGARADFILVLTRNDFDARYNGFTTFVVDTTSPGFALQRKLDKLGWRASDTAEMSFDNVELDDSCVLGKVGEGWLQASKNLHWERLMLTLTALGGARVCLRDTWRYAHERKAFGRQIAEFGSVGKMFEVMAHKVILGEALCHRCLDLLSAGKEARAEIAAAKRIVCEDMIWLADRCIQIHGGYGYTTAYSPERWWRDLRLMTIGGGTSEVMANLVAKELRW